MHKNLSVDKFNLLLFGHFIVEAFSSPLFFCQYRLYLLHEKVGLGFGQY
jgi:hypothetical protein